MKSILRLAAVAVGSLMSVGAAHAATYDFSYNFVSSNDTVTGSFDGDLADGIIGNFSDFNVVFDNTKVIANSDSVYGDISIDGSSFDFIIYSPSSTAILTGITSGSFGYQNVGLGFAVYDFAPNLGKLIIAPAISAVPETGNAAMLLAGLGLMGAVVRRRNASKQA